jgi:PPK2 family polyphosphate:nucleotide phosphotransferase
MGKKHRFSESKFVVDYGKKLDLSKRSTQAGKELKDKTQAAEELAADVSALQAAQQVLYASDSHSLLVIFQGMDAAGKDGTIRHVMGGVNPQGCRVYSFKAPNSTELQHHFLWRAMQALPERGMISLFNRSYYEEVLVVRVHPQFLVPQKLPNLEQLKPKSLEKLWTQRYKEINAFERTLARQGTIVLKFFLNVSRDEQKERFLERLNDPDKYWKFNAGDLAERKLWPDYQAAIEDALAATSTPHAPWFVIPADDKWYARAAIADIIAGQLEQLGLHYPSVPDEEKTKFAEYARQLVEEDDATAENE